MLGDVEETIYVVEDDEDDQEVKVRDTNVMRLGIRADNSLDHQETV